MDVDNLRLGRVGVQDVVRHDGGSLADEREALVGYLEQGGATVDGVVVALDEVLVGQFVGGHRHLGEPHEQLPSQLA